MGHKTAETCDDKALEEAQSPSVSRIRANFPIHCVDFFLCKPLKICDNVCVCVCAYLRVCVYIYMYLYMHASYVCMSVCIIHTYVHMYCVSISPLIILHTDVCILTSELAIVLLMCC
jgi:hypothetical protein